MRLDAIEGLNAAQIKDKFALPELPVYITDVKVPAGTKLRIGKVAPVEGWGEGGAYQYELLERIDENLFTNTRLIK